jgi:predicted NBD/HSP70 family sugar kinase
MSALHSVGLVATDGVRQRAGRGRPGEQLRIDPGFGLVAVIEVDLESAWVAVFDFGQTELARFRVPIALTDSPARVVDVLAEATRDHIDALGLGLRLRAATIAVAAPVDIRHGRIVGPSFLAQWDGYPVKEAFAAALGCPVELGNDSGLRAFGEARSTPADAGPLVYVRIGAGIGAGYIDRTTQMVTGADGAAGEISHMRSVRREGRVCLCGNVDHLHAYASVTAMLEEWRSSAAGRMTDSVADFENALRLRDRDATRIAVGSAREIGAAITEIILVLNPDRVVLGGRILEASDTILSTVRAVVYDTGLSLATRNLSVTHSSLGESAGLVGGLALALERSLSADEIARYLSTSE